MRTQSEKHDAAGEVAWLIELHAAQTEGALRELETLTTQLEGAFALFAAQFDSWRSSADQRVPLVDELGSCIRALQRHDLLRQRLEHLLDGLRAVGRAVDAGGAAASSDAHEQLRVALRASYSLADECRVFDALARPGNRCDMSPALSPQEIELF